MNRPETSEDIHSAEPRMLETVGLEGGNSLEFLREAFRLYESGRLFTIRREGIDLSAYPGLQVVENRPTGDTRGWGRFSHYITHDDAPAQIVFSSGTEGLPKAIVLSGRALGDVVTRLNRVMGIDENIREYIGVPVTYSFGLGRARAVAAAGGAFYLPERFDPAEIREMLARDEINAISAVPSLWRVLLTVPGALGEQGGKVRWIEIGSQYMTGEEKAAMRRMFPEARIVQHYGLTEASRSTFLVVDKAGSAELESVGRPFGETEIRIGDEGEICIRGPHLASGLLQADGGIASLADTEGWLHTSDRGAVREGYLFYLGRLDDQINISGLKLAAESLEQEIAALVTVSPGSFAVTPVPDPLRGDAILLAIGPEAQPFADLLEAGARHALLARGIQQPAILKLWPVETLPVTGSGKVQRKALRERWLAEAPSMPGHAKAGAAPQADLTTEEAALVATWQSVVGQIPIGPEDNFYDVGGDSLGALQIGLTMEARFPRAAVQATLAGQSVREIAALGQGGEAPPRAERVLPRQTVESWAINAARGLMVISVLVSHWAPGVFARLGTPFMDSWLAFFYRLGTPGFALVFGLGIGFFMLPGYREKRASVHRRLLASFGLVGAGLLLMAAVTLLRESLSDGTITERVVAESFYRVLAYYLLAIASVPLWLGALARLKDPLPAIVVAAAAFWAAWWGADALWQGPPLESWLEWPRLMAIASYSYFRVSAFVFAGIAVGVWMARQEEVPAAARTLLLAGTAGTALSLFAGLESYGAGAFAARMAPFFTSTMGALFFLSLLGLVLGTTLHLVMAWNRLGRVRAGVMQSLILLGGLALPIYAFHAVVIPIRDILVIIGLPRAVALLLSLGSFLALLGYGIWRLRRMYFA